MAEEIEVTPEMIEAGAAVLGGTVITKFAGEEYWARETYRAMEAKRREQAANRDPGDETKGTK